MTVPKTFNLPRTNMNNTLPPQRKYPRPRREGESGAAVSGLNQTGGWGRYRIRRNGCPAQVGRRRSVADDAEVHQAGLDDADEEAHDEAEELDGAEVLLGDREDEVFELLDGVARDLLLHDAFDVEIGDGRGQALARGRLDAVGEHVGGAAHLLLGQEVADAADGPDEKLLDLRGEDGVDGARRLLAREHADEAAREQPLDLLGRVVARVFEERALAARLLAFERVGEVGRDRGRKLRALRHGEDAFGDL